MRSVGGGRGGRGAGGPWSGRERGPRCFHQRPGPGPRPPPTPASLPRGRTPWGWRGSYRIAEKNNFQFKLNIISELQQVTQIRETAGSVRQDAWDGRPGSSTGPLVPRLWELAATPLRGPHPPHTPRALGPGFPTPPHTPQGSGPGPGFSQTKQRTWSVGRGGQDRSRRALAWRRHPGRRQDVGAAPAPSEPAEGHLPTSKSAARGSRGRGPPSLFRRGPR